MNWIRMWFRRVLCGLMPQESAMDVIKHIALDAIHRANDLQLRVNALEASSALIDVHPDDYQEIRDAAALIARRRLMAEKRAATQP